jgi:tetratricopeptide (TPR) repeat protein
VSARPILIAIGVLATAGAQASANREPATLGQLASRSAPLDRGVAVEAATGDAARSYEDFLRIPGTDPALRAQALRRLGDLRLEESESLSAQEGRQSAQATVAARQAIDAYRQLLEEQPGVAGADTVLYQLARAYDAVGEGETAQATLDELVTRFPQGAHYDEAQFRRGEALFAERRYADAERAYAAVQAMGPASEFYVQAVYKRGWSLFKQSRDDESTAAFLDLLDHVLVRDGQVRREAELSRPEQELSGDALRALAITFAAGDGPRSLEEALAQHGAAPYESRLYASLGDLYVEKERYQDAAEAYRAFASQRPMNADAPLLIVQATAAYERGGFASLVLDSKRQLVEQYGPGSEYWQAHERDLDPAVSKAVQADLLDLARHHHALAQQGSAADRAAAVNWYRRYLAGFDHEPGAPATRMLLADLQFDGGQFADAAGDYELAAYSYAANPDAARAGYAALVAWDKAVVAVTPADRATVEARGIDSSLRFAAAFPDHPETPAVLTRTAKALFDAGDSARAQAAAQQVLALGPRATDAQQRVAWTVLAHTAFDEQRYADAEKAYSELARRLPAGDPQSQEVTDRLAASVYRQAEQRQRAGDAAGAVQDFLRVAVVAPGSDAAAKGQYDAATLLIAAHDWPQAATVLERLRSDYPDDALQPEVTRKLAVVYQEAGRGRDAAVELERIAATVGEDTEVRRAAQWNAATLYAAAHDVPAAERAYANYVAQFPVPVDAAIEARQELATMAATAGDAGTRQHWLTEIVAADQASGASRTDRTRYLAAHAALELARPLDADARAIPLTVPLDRSLARRKAAMESALDGWSRAADYGVADVTTAATYAMADQYRDFAAALLASERPKGLSADELEQYGLLLEEQAYPFEEKAISIHEMNAHRAATGTWDEWVQKSYVALAAMKPARYERAEKVDAADAAPGTPPEAVLALTAALAALDTADTTAALENVDAALALDPGNAVARNLEAVALRRAGRFAEARTAYEKAITQAPGYATPERNLGVLLDLYLDAPADALPHYERYQELTGGADSGTGRWLVELRTRLGQNERTAEARP